MFIKFFRVCIVSFGPWKGVKGVTQRNSIRSSPLTKSLAKRSNRTTMERSRFIINTHSILTHRHSFTFYCPTTRLVVVVIVLFAKGWFSVFPWTAICETRRRIWSIYRSFTAEWLAKNFYLGAGMQFKRDTQFTSIRERFRPAEAERISQQRRFLWTKGERVMVGPKSIRSCSLSGLRTNETNRPFGSLAQFAGRSGRRSGDKGDKTHEFLLGAILCPLPVIHSFTQSVCPSLASSTPINDPKCNNAA